MILAGGAAGFAAILGGSRRVHRDLAAEAQERARSIEAQLFRLGLAMEWRSAGPTLYQEALARLEAREQRGHDDG